jgi:serine O-acetyltransferase
MEACSNKGYGSAFWRMLWQPLLRTDFYRQIREDLSVHYGEWDRPGFRALAVHRFGAMLTARKDGPLTKFLFVLYRLMYRYVRNYYGIELPATTKVGRRLLLAHQHGIVIHPRAVIGDDCIILHNCTVGATTRARIQQAPKLGNRVQLGCNVVIIGNVVIGDDVRIGPNATIMTNIPAGTTVVTAPPRLVKPIALTENQFRPSK